MSRICRRDGVDDDIYDLALYLLDHSEDAARRFVDAIQKTLKDLAQMPGMGSRKDFRDPALADVRSWWIEDFPITSFTIARRHRCPGGDARRPRR